MKGSSTESAAWAKPERGAATVARAHSPRPDIRLDATSATPYVAQLVGAIKKNIAAGSYKTGDVLPGIHDLARSCHVSERVPRMALAQLAAEGWTKPKRGVGSVVIDRGVRVRENGRVLVYLRSVGYGYYFAELVSILSLRLLSVGYRMTIVHADQRTETDKRRKLDTLLRENWSLVLTIGADERIWRQVAASGWPFVRVGGGVRMPPFSAPSCIGSVEIRTDKAKADLVKACVSHGIRRAVQFYFDAGAFDIEDMMRYVGIDLKTLHVPHQPTPEDVSRKGMEMMRGFLRRSRSRLPGILLFADDFLAQGALLALMEAGVRIPEDIGVVTLANLGLGPVWIKPLTRLEMSPFAHAKALSDAVIAYLREGTLALNLDLGSNWRTGDTF